MISVIVINWNRAADAEQAVHSVLKRNPSGGFQILLWDNGSLDDSHERLTRAFGKTPEVRLVFAGENLGVCAGRNRAVEQAEGDVLVFMDSDSLLETTGAFERLEAAFRDQPDTGAFNFEIHQGGKILWPFHRPEAVWGERSFDITRIDGCGFAIRKDVFLLAGGFPEHFGYGAEEHYLARRVIAEGFRVVYFPEIAVTHLKVPSGRTSDQFSTTMRNHIWMPMELFRMPWALASALHMIQSYAQDAHHEDRWSDFRKGLAMAVKEFRFERRKPMSREAWRHFRNIIQEDRRAGTEQPPARTRS